MYWIVILILITFITHIDYLTNNLTGWNCFNFKCNENVNEHKISKHYLKLILCKTMVRIFSSLINLCLYLLMVLANLNPMIFSHLRSSRQKGMLFQKKEVWPKPLGVLKMEQLSVKFCHFDDDWTIDLQGLTEWSDNKTSQMSSQYHRFVDILVMVVDPIYITSWHNHLEILAVHNHECQRATKQHRCLIQ